MSVSRISRREISIHTRTSLYRSGVRVCQCRDFVCPKCFAAANSKPCGHGRFPAKVRVFSAELSCVPAVARWCAASQVERQDLAGGGGAIKLHWHMLRL